MEQVVVKNQIMIDELHQFVAPVSCYQVEALLPDCRVPRLLTRQVFQRFSHRVSCGVVHDERIVSSRTPNVSDGSHASVGLDLWNLFAFPKLRPEIAYQKGGLANAIDRWCQSYNRLRIKLPTDPIAPRTRCPVLLANCKSTRASI